MNKKLKKIITPLTIYYTLVIVLSLIGGLIVVTDLNQIIRNYSRVVMHNAAVDVMIRHPELQTHDVVLNYGVGSENAETLSQSLEEFRSYSGFRSIHIVSEHNGVYHMINSSYLVSTGPASMEAAWGRIGKKVTHYIKKTKKTNTPIETHITFDPEYSNMQYIYPIQSDDGKYHCYIVVGWNRSMVQAIVLNNFLSVIVSIFIAFFVACLTAKIIPIKRFMP